MFKLGERGSGFRPKAGDVQDFVTLRDQCLQKGALFEDPDFDTVDSSIFFSKKPDKRFEWKRPSVSIVYLSFVFIRVGVIRIKSKNCLFFFFFFY